MGFSRRRAGRIGLLLEGTPSILGAAGSSKPGPGLWDPAGKRRVRWFGLSSTAVVDEALPGPLDGLSSVVGLQEAPSKLCSGMAASEGRMTVGAVSLIIYRSVSGQRSSTNSSSFLSDLRQYLVFGNSV